PVFFFFFQAEDGIRDFHVTGVQTCALPICGGWRGAAEPVAVIARRRLSAGGLCTDRPGAAGAGLQASAGPADATGGAAQPRLRRSEERRVGKECRSRGWPRASNKTGAERSA